jgi:acylphosphatase
MISSVARVPKHLDKTLETAVQLNISGHVQNVGYRYWARSFATQLGLKGWVRNLEDGSVELLAIGATADLDRLIDACRIGPSNATVNHVAIADIQAPNAVQGFEIQA